MRTIIMTIAWTMQLSDLVSTQKTTEGILSEYDAGYLSDPAG
jgi:hypothetical protein